MNHEEMNQRFSRLENEIAELNKKLSALMPSEDAKKRRDEQFAAFAYFHERRSLNNFHRDRVITFEQIAE
ncbi:hypothetical protein BvCmsOUNP049_00896 [Escherichia coli]|uniref:hypothetical protein n=1 Tax=Escherichia coli TaxID=562 RepID=UPI0010F0F223|nr:hypothetical protein [Escherichia coli]GDT70037.1 hypothetical protein BvCmsOUNP049_00896 [Escherichia coli]